MVFSKFVFLWYHLFCSAILFAIWFEGLFVRFRNIDSKTLVKDIIHLAREKKNARLQRPQQICLTDIRSVVDGRKQTPLKLWSQTAEKEASQSHAVRRA